MNKDDAMDFMDEVQLDYLAGNITDEEYWEYVAILSPVIDGIIG